MTIIPEDPFGSSKDRNYKGVNPETVKEFHRRSDVDGSPFSQHHTIGKGRNQAAAGDHLHNIEQFMAHAWSPGPLTLVSAAMTTLFVGAEEHDPSGMYTQATGIYLIQKAGVYEITGSIYFPPRPAVATHLLLTAAVNGSEANGARWSSIGSTANAGQGCGGSVSRILAVGATVSFAAYQDSGFDSNVERMSTMVKLIRAT